MEIIFKAYTLQLRIPIGGRLGLRGKSWSVEEERRLRELIGEGLGIDRISKVMGKTRVSVMNKIYHLGLALVDDATAQQKQLSSSSPSSSTPSQTINQALNDSPIVASATPPNPVATPAAMPSPSEVDAFAAQIKKGGPLPSIEEKLRVLDAALVALEKPGISRAEVARYSKIIDGVKVYNDLFAKFVNYRGLEIKVLELERRLANEKNQP
jgi:hypothetical protein